MTDRQRRLLLLAIDQRVDEAAPNATPEELAELLTGEGIDAEALDHWRPGMLVPMRADRGRDEP